MSTEESVDPRLLEQAQQQIRGLMDEIVGLSRQDLAPEVFFAEYLTRVTAALAALGGAVWNVESQGFQLQQELNISESGLPALEQEHLVRHHGLLQKVASSGQGLIVGPRQNEGQEGANPTDMLLVLAPLRVADQTRGVVEIFQRPGAPQRTQRGYLSFLLQVCELAADYLRNRQLRQFIDRQSMWQQLDQFTRSVHGSLDPLETAYTVANEGRRLIGCDRVSVATMKGRQCKIQAISGQDVFDVRALAVRLLSELATTVAAGGEPVSYRGDTADFPPQVEEAILNYVDESHSKHIDIIPLRRAKPTAHDHDQEHEVPLEPVVGCLIIEQIEDTRPKEGFEQRIAIVSEHSAAALANTEEHNRLFLMPVWRAIGNSRWVIEARTLPKTLSIVGGVLLVIASLFIIPWRFTVSSEGSLQPVTRREVFAPQDGVVEAVAVKHGDTLKPGDLLVELRNTDLEVAIADVLGQRLAAQEQLRAVDNARMLVEKGKAASPEERARLEGQRAELKQKITALEQQLELMRQKQARLKVYSPIGGVVTTWNIEQLLRQRPVRQGQELLSVADTSGEWELELQMDESRMGHLGAAQHRLGDNLRVTYRLATEPGVDHEGTVIEVHRAAEVHGEKGNTVLVRVRIDKHELEHIRPGADVIAKVHCGTQSLGYVLFHDVIAFIQSRVLFRF